MAKRNVALSKQYAIRWVPLAFAITVLSGLVYVAMQQDIRSSANEPQLQMATDISAGLSVRQEPETLLPKQSIDISLSGSPFVIIYDESGKPVASSVVSSGQTPTPPLGVFEYTRSHIDDRVTWEPTPGLRIATVIQHYKSSDGSGFVLVGRNMRETERNESTILQLAALGWFVAMAGSLGLMIITEEMTRRG